MNKYQKRNKTYKYRYGEDYLTIREKKDNEAKKDDNICDKHIDGA